jgi:hypothetical protein
MKKLFLVAVLLVLPSPSWGQDLGRIRAGLQEKQYVSEESRQRAERIIAEIEADAREKAHQEEMEQVKIASWIYVGVAAADWSVTAACFKQHCDGVPGYRASYLAWGNGFEEPAVATILGVALDAAVVFAVNQWVAEEHPRVAQAILYGLSGVRLVILTDRVSDLRNRR